MYLGKPDTRRCPGLCLRCCLNLGPPQSYIDDGSAWNSLPHAPLSFLLGSTMSSVLSSGSSSTSQVSVASTTSTPISSTNTIKHLSPIVIAIILVGSIAFGLLLVVVLIYAPTTCRSRRKHQHLAGDKYKTVDTLESGIGVSVSSVSKSYQDDWRSVYEYEETTLPSFTKNQQQQSLNRSITRGSQYSALANPWSSSHFVNESEDQATEEIHIADAQPQSPGDTEPLGGFEILTLHSARPSSSSSISTINFAPLTIPEKPLNHSDEEKCSIKRKGSTQSTTTIDTDDSHSLYSEASASEYTPYSSRSSLETVVPPPVPLIPPPSTTTPTHPTLPQNVDAIASARKREEAIIKPSPTTSLLTPLPVLRINREEEEEQDGAEIYNVAKLLHSRQSRVQTTLSDPPSRNSSIVSHIERSGSIKPVILPPEEEESESYRPRYHRLKQNWNTRRYASTPHIGEPFNLPSSHLRASSQVVGS